jgi:epoxyqueuosine reductase
MSALDDLAGLVREDGIILAAAPAAAYADTERAIRDRRARGLFADMGFTMRQPERSCHPELAVRGARTVVTALLSVARRPPPRPEGALGRLPRYAWGDPYATLRGSLARVRDALRADGRRAAVFVDSNHHVDREGARQAGLTFYGKNTMAIAPGLGSYIAIGTLITDAALVASAPPPVRDGCGACTRCVDACPTGALDEPGTLDATRCLSYWTQSRHDAPPDVASALEDRVYGCDICQDACPYTTGPAARAPGEASPEEAFVDLASWLHEPADHLLRRYGRLYIPDRDVRYLRRNALVALGNGPAGDRHLAEPFRDHPDAVLRGPARRAL